MCENTQSASWLGGCSRLRLAVSLRSLRSLRIQSLRFGLLPRQKVEQALVLVQARASLPSIMETISPTAHIDWVSCRYVRASIRPLQREVTRWGNCVSNAEIASTTKIVDEIHDGDKQPEARHCPKQLGCRSCPESLLYFRSFWSSSARPSAEFSGSSKQTLLQSATFGNWALDTYR